MLGLFWVALTSFALSLALVPACRSIALRLGYVAATRDDRWHRRPTALLGGVAIALAVFGTAPFFGITDDLAILMVGAAAMFALGLVDDLVTLAPYTKLVIEIGVASVFVFFGYRLDWTDWAAVDVMLTMVWIVGLTNALNLLDNMDGLCAGIAVIAGASLLGAFTTGGATPEATYLALMLGALAGFLVYNFHPASIFMGDSGSLFVGLNLAVLTLGSPDESYSRTNVISILIGPVLVLLVPILDTALVTVSRLLSGRSAAQGGRDHASHRLVALGLSEREAVAVLWSMAAFSGLLAVMIYRFQSGWPGTAAAAFLIGMILFVVFLSRVRVYVNPESARFTASRFTPFVTDIMYKRRLAEVLLDVCLVALAYQMAYRLRFEGPAFNGYYDNFLASLPLVVGVQSVALYAVGAYKGVWRLFGLMDGVTFAKGVLLGALTNVSAIVYLYRFENYSRGVFVIYAALLMLMLCGSRASFRLFSEFTNRRRPKGPRLVIYGPGDGAATSVRTMLDDTDGGCRMLGFIDDDPLMAGVRMQGYAVLGGYPVLMKLIADGQVEKVVITTPLIDVERLERLRKLCAERNVSLARLHVELSHLVAVS
ncbi:MAG: hypothetical protein AB7F99_07495 [Vicinamibacterales bacterium]